MFEIYSFYWQTVTLEKMDKFCISSVISTIYIIIHSKFIFP